MHSLADTETIPLTDREFAEFQRLIYDLAGIHMTDAKKALISGRLMKRLRHYALRSFSAYLAIVTDSANVEERQTMVNLLTTNETYFFREPKHFDYLAGTILPALCQRDGGNRLLRFWSAASSTGEEAYSLAMSLMDNLGDERPWEIVGTDISRDVLARARQGVYRTERIDGVPPDYLRRYFLRGIGSRVGTLRVVPEVRARVQFSEANLNESLAAVGEFDVIFLRNVLIYFDLPTKREIVERVARQLRRGGWLFIGHSESLNGVTPALQPVRPTIYQRD